ncbi:hypothetical protein D3C72_2462510 [compost metagenome]
MLGGQHQDGNARIALGGAQTADQREAIHAGHDLVRDQHAEAGAGRERMCLVAVGRLGHVKPSCAQAGADHAA